MGTEAGLQVAQQWCQRNRSSRNKVFLKLDFSNAFNTVSREVFLRELRAHFPGLAPWAEFCYGSPSRLLFGTRTIPSETGVQQGDPLGPLLFALALQPVLSELAGSRSEGGLELVYSYLDDLCLAGDAVAVAAVLRTLKGRCATSGLELSTGTANSRDKCELILAGQGLSTVDVGLFPGDFKVIRDGNFELLGGPVGSQEFCNTHTQARVTKALRLLEGLGELPDPQVALQLLRHCAAFNKMVYSIRVVPPSSHSEALQAFDANVRASFEQFACLHLDDEQWAQATLGTSSGGLGLRSLARHSHAAFLASRTGGLELCKKLDPNHSLHSGGEQAQSPEQAARDAYNRSVNDDDQLPPGNLEGLSQKAMSAAIDKRTGMQLAANACQSRRAHLKLLGVEGAGIHLQAAPSKAAKLDNEPALFVGMLRRWLRMRFAEQDMECPCCDGVLDAYGDHALVCCGGGDRTRRHNLLRNIAFHAAEAASLRPEMERPGLLPQRPLMGPSCEDGAPVEVGDGTAGSRRPADVYIPRWRYGPPAAWDFAVTSGLRLDLQIDAATSPGSVTTRYEDFKCGYRDTRSECSAQGVSFIPMVVEAVGGGWGKMARCVWSELAKSSCLATGELESTRSCAIMLQQRLAMTLHRENARACLKRFGP